MTHTVSSSNYALKDNKDNSCPYKFHPLEASFVISDKRLPCPQEWKPPKFNLELAAKLDSPYYRKVTSHIINNNILNPINRPLIEQPSCYNKHGLTKHIGFIWWHPFTDVSFCQNHIDDVIKSWYYTNWLLLKYHRILTELINIR